MRYFIAFSIALTVYLLLAFLYITKFSYIEVKTPLQRNNHIIKIDIRNIPDPIVAPPLPQPKKVVQKLIKPEPPKKIIVPKKIVKKKVIVKKKPAKKRVVIKKKPVKKKIIKKKQIKKRPKQPIIKQQIVKKRVVQELPIAETQPITPFEEEMVYIPEPIIKREPKIETAQSSDLGSFLSSPSTPIASTNSYPNSKIKKLYGSSFHRMTPTQKRFIENNLDSIQEITQQTLTLRGYPEGAGRTGQEGTNVVTFKLHPNGNISNLRLKTRIGYRSLDENTLSLIRVAYKDYPYPSTTTQITFYVHYTIYGY